MSPPSQLALACFRTGLDPSIYGGAAGYPSVCRGLSAATSGAWVSSRIASRGCASLHPSLVRKHVSSLLVRAVETTATKARSVPSDTMKSPTGDFSRRRPTSRPCCREFIRPAIRSGRFCPASARRRRADWLSSAAPMGLMGSHRPPIPGTRCRAKISSPFVHVA
jgi:hypothetical protein